MSFECDEGKNGKLLWVYLIGVGVVLYAATSILAMHVFAAS
ncbi:MAG: hypothetical protein WCK73_12970 [Deltaproteobacteria bacterium]